MIRLVAWTAQAPRAVLYEPERNLLLEVGSGKLLEVTGAQFDEGPPVRLKLAGGGEVSLSEAGVRFAPGFVNTGVLKELAPQVGWSEFFERLARLRDTLYSGRAEVGAGAVRELMCCLAILDGARAVGFEVGEQEHELEWHLAELERRAPREEG